MLCSNKTTYVLLLIVCLINKFGLLSATDDVLVGDEDTVVGDGATLDINLTAVSETEEPTPSLTDEDEHLKSDKFTSSLQYTESVFTQETAPESFAHVSDSLIREDRIKVKVQKCCDKGKILVVGSAGGASECQDPDKKNEFIIDVFSANETHYWNYTKSNESNVDIIVKDPCTMGKYFLNPNEDADDTFFLLVNGSLYIPSEYEMLDRKNYCIDIIKVNDAELLVSAMICVGPVKASGFHYIYGTGLLISMASLSALAVYSMYRKDIDDEHKKCLSWFSSTLALTFFFRALSTFFGRSFNSGFNIFIVYLIFYLKMKSVLWLNILCWDTFLFIKHSNTSNNTTRVSHMTKYIGIAFCVPFILVFINFIDIWKPALPNLHMQFYYTNDKLWCILLYFVPIGLSAIFNIILWFKTAVPKKRYSNIKELIDDFKRTDWNPPPANITALRNMYRRILALFILVFGCWLLDLILFCLPSTGEQSAQFILGDVVSCLEGLFISLIFVKKEWLNCEKKEEKLNETEMAMLNTSNNTTNTEDAITTVIANN